MEIAMEAEGEVGGFRAGRGGGRGGSPAFCQSRVCSVKIHPTPISCTLQMYFCIYNCIYISVESFLQHHTVVFLLSEFIWKDNGREWRITIRLGFQFFRREHTYTYKLSLQMRPMQAHTLVMRFEPSMYALCWFNWIIHGMLKTQIKNRRTQIFKNTHWATEARLV